MRSLLRRVYASRTAGKSQIHSVPCSVGQPAENWAGRTNLLRIIGVYSGSKAFFAAGVMRAKLFCRTIPLHSSVSLFGAVLKHPESFGIWWMRREKSLQKYSQAFLEAAEPCCRGVDQNEMWLPKTTTTSPDLSRFETES